MDQGRCNGFTIRGLNQDCTHVAVQSSEQTTWQLGYRRFGLSKAHEVGILQNELVVIRSYGGAPEFEIAALGDRCGVLILQLSRGPTFVLRAGSKRVIALDRDESCVIRCEGIQYPTSPGVGAGAYGQGLRV